jgi:Glycoside hydrolase 123, catalytic domain/Glycoside hydrolase 123 N-terminal domain
MSRKSLYVSLFLFILLCQHFQTSLFKSESADSAVKVWVSNPLNHVWQDTPPGTVTTIEIAGARNEVESFQVTISSPVRKLEGVSVSVSDLEDGRGNRISQSHIQLYRQEYVYVRNPSPHSKDPPGWWPDPLVPVANPYDGKPVSAMRLTREEERGQVSYKLSGARFPGNDFTVWPQRNQPLWADVSIPSDAIAGNYSGKFSIALAEKGRIELPVTLTVWNFSLPSELPLSTQFGSLDGVAAKHGVAEGSSEALELEERYAGALEAHRIAAPIPSRLYPPIRRDGVVDWKKTHEALKRYLNSHQTGPFRIPNFPDPEFQGKGKRVLVRYLQSYFEYLKANGWAKGAYYFPVQEPNSKEAYDRVRVYAQVVREAEPRIRMFCTEQSYSQDSSWGDLQGAVNIWCPLFAFFDEESARKARASGDEIWTYTALCQKSPPYHPQFARVSGQPTLFWQIDFPRLHYRLPLWLSWRYQIQGLLYWSAVHWKSPDRDVWTDPGFRNHYNGEGYLLYPGVGVGIPGPVPSLRLKALRDGLEDYAYFALLANLGEREFLDKEIAKIATSWWKWDEDPDHLYQARAVLAKRILEHEGH